MAYKRRRDANHTAIAKDLQLLGFRVSDLSGVGGGVPDLFVSRNGVGRFVEVKTAKGLSYSGPSSKATRARQLVWAALHEGLVITATSAEEVDSQWPSSTP